MDPARRQLIRGSLSAPLVLTVASPSALAATSLHACIARGEQPAASQAFVPSHDGWYRTHVAIYEGKTSASGAQALYYLNTGDNMYYRVDGTQCGIGIPQTSFYNGSAAYKYHRYGLVYVNSEGVPVGYGACPNGGRAIHGSCWSSFA